MSRETHRCCDCAAWTARPDLRLVDGAAVWGDCGKGHGLKPSPTAACRDMAGVTHRLGFQRVCEDFVGPQRGLFG